MRGKGFLIYFSLYLYRCKKGVKIQHPNEKNFKNFKQQQQQQGKNYTLILLLLYCYCSYLLLLVWNFSTRGSGEFPLG
jgi:hypothetical protein